MTDSLSYRLDATLSFDDIRAKLNWWGRIRDPISREAYYDYQARRRNALVGNFFVTILMVVSYLPTAIIHFEDEIEMERPVATLLLSALLCVLISLAVLTNICIIIADHQWFNPVYQVCQRYARVLHRTFFLCCAFSVTAIFCKEVFLTSCPNEVPNCTVPESVRRQLIFTDSYVIFTTLLFGIINLPSLEIEIVWIALLSNVVVIFVALLQIGSYSEEFRSLFFWTILIAGTIVDIHLRNLMQYFMAEKEKLQSEQHTAELKHTIANVAHDLKTPLSSFTNAMDLLLMLWPDIIESQHEMDYEKMKVLGKQVTDCLKSMKCTNSFMLMAINRCLDSTKASNNMKLLAKNESVDLLECIALPLSIMQTVQTKLEVKLELAHSVSSAVVTHIITDQQWLQENILCLLSNAVKYSSRGVVVLRLKCAPSLEAVELEEHLNDTAEEDGEEKGREEHHVERVSWWGSVMQCICAFRTNRPLILPVQENSMQELDASLFQKAKETPKSRHIKLSRCYPQQSTGADDCNNSMLSITQDSMAQLIFEVEDEGIGITKEGRKKLFHPFQQTQRMAGGTGLGLYSLAKRIEAIKGKYGVRNRSDGTQGSLFWFSIPYRPDEVMSKGERIDISNIPCRTYSSVSLSPERHANASDFIEGNCFKLPASAEENGSTFTSLSRIHTSADQLHRPGRPNLRCDTLDQEYQEKVKVKSIQSTSRLGVICETSLVTKPPLIHACSDMQGVDTTALPSNQDKYGRGLKPNTPRLLRSNTVNISAPCSPVQTNLLPTTNPPNRSAQLFRHPSEHMSAIVLSNPLHVLLVDDAPTILKMTAVMLQRMGCQVQTAENGQEAIDKLLSRYNTAKQLHQHNVSDSSSVTITEKHLATLEPFHLVLMDLQMPVLDGLEATRRIRRLPDACLRDVIIIGLSANSDEDTMQEAHRAGANKFLSKPFTVERFQFIVKEFFSHLLTLSI